MGAHLHGAGDITAEVTTSAAVVPTLELNDIDPAATQSNAGQVASIYKNSLDSIDAIIGVFDANCCLLYGNAALARWCGVEQHELVGRHVSALTPYQFPRLEADIKQVFISNQGITVERSSMYPTPVHWYRISVQPVRDSSGAVIAAIASGWDITESKQRAPADILAQLEMEHLLTVIARRFVSLPYNQVDVALEQTLAEVGAFTKADCVHLFFTDAAYMGAASADVAACRHWCAVGIEEGLSERLDAAFPTLTWSIATIKRDEVLDIPCVDDLPAEAHNDKQVLQALGIQSLLAVAFSAPGDIHAVLCASTVSRQHPWRRADRLLLKLVGDTLAKAKARWHDEARLQELHRSLEQRFAERTIEALRLARAMEASSEGMAIIQDDRFVYVNPAFARMHGYTVHDLIGQSWRTLYVFSDDDDLIQSVTAVLRSEGAWTGVTTARNSHGDLFETELTLTKVEGELILSERNVTERIQAERALHRAEKRYHSLFENAPVMYATLGEDALGIPIITDCNRQFLTTLGYSREEIVGQWLGYIHSPESRKSLCERFMRGEARLMMAEECELVTASGQRLLALLQTRRDMDAEGRFIQAMAMYIDISALKQAEAQLRDLGEQYRKLAQRLVAAREDERTSIAREIHDDLGQMLTALKLDIDWLAKKLPPQTPPMITKKLESMRASVSATISSVQRLTQKLRPSLLDTLGLVPAIDWQLQQIQERTELTTTLVANTPEDLVLPPGLATALFRVFQEALTNVVRHAHAHRVDVHLSLRKNQLWLVIRDDGCGFDPAALNAANSLGLVGMRERLAPWQGTLELASAPGHGAEVHAIVPVPITVYDQL